MSDQSIGSVSASVLLRTDSFLSAAAQAVSAFMNMGASMEAQAASTQAAVEASMAAMGVAIIGLGVTVAAESIKIGSEMEQMFLHLQANTGSTDAQLSEMKDGILQLGKESGESFQSLADGMMHVRNMTFQGADAMKVMQAATEAAVATGAQASNTANLLATTMHEFNIAAGEALPTMNLLLVAAQKGNTTLQQFVDASGQVFGQAANMGISLRDAATAMATLSLHGFTAATAATQLLGLFKQMSQPTATVEKYIASLGESGKILAEDFTSAGVRARGFSGILDDVRAVAAQTGTSFDELAEHLFVAQRGGRAALVLLGSGTKDYQQVAQDLADAQEGKITPAQKGYNTELESMGTQMNRLKNESGAAAKAFYDNWEPVLTKLVKLAGDLAHLFSLLGPRQGPDAHITPEELGRRFADYGGHAYGAGASTGVGSPRAAIEAQLARVGRMVSSKPPTSLTDIFGGQVPSQFDMSNVAGLNDPTLFQGRRTPPAKPDPLGGLTQEQADRNDAIMERYNVRRELAEERAAERSRKRGATEAQRKIDEAARTAQKVAEEVKKAEDNSYAATHSRYQVELKDAEERYRSEMLSAKGNAKAIADIQAGYVAIKKRLMEEEFRAQGDYIQRAFAQVIEDAKRKENLAKETAEKLQRIEDERNRQQRRAEEDGARYGEAIQREFEKNIEGAVKSATEKIKELGKEMNRQTQAMAQQSADLVRNSKTFLADQDNQEREARLKSLNDLKASLQAKLALVKKYSADYWAIMQRIQQIDEEIDKAKVKSPWEQMIQNMQDFAKKTLVTDLGNAFVNGWKGFFKTILGQFEQMIAQMAAQALVAGIFNLLGMGGGLGGGLFGGAVGGLFSGGFDNPSNDRAANRWGWDLASHLSKGIDSYNNQRGGMARSLAGAGASGGGGMNIHVNMTGDNHFHGDQDARHVADAIAWHTQSRLTVMRKPK